MGDSSDVWGVGKNGPAAWDRCNKCLYFHNFLQWKVIRIILTFNVLTFNVEEIGCFHMNFAHICTWMQLFGPETKGNKNFIKCSKSINIFGLTCCPNKRWQWKQKSRNVCKTHLAKSQTASLEKIYNPFAANGHLIWAAEKESNWLFVLLRHKSQSLQNAFPWKSAWGKSFLLGEATELEGYRCDHEVWSFIRQFFSCVLFWQQVNPSILFWVIGDWWRAMKPNAADTWGLKQPHIYYHMNQMSSQLRLCPLATNQIF